MFVVIANTDDCMFYKDISLDDFLIVRCHGIVGDLGWLEDGILHFILKVTSVVLRVIRNHRSLICLQVLLALCQLCILPNSSKKVTK